MIPLGYLTKYNSGSCNPQDLKAKQKVDLWYKEIWDLKRIQLIYFDLITVFIIKLYKKICIFTGSFLTKDEVLLFS